MFDHKLAKMTSKFNFEIKKEMIDKIYFKNHMINLNKLKNAVSKEINNTQKNISIMNDKISLNENKIKNYEDNIQSYTNNSAGSRVRYHNYTVQNNVVLLENILLCALSVIFIPTIYIYYDS